MPVDVKICGLKEQSHCETAIATGARMIGFVFFPKSPRHIELAQAKQLADMYRDKIEIVALTVHAADKYLADIVSIVQPDYIQCHGDETPERLNDIRTNFDVKIIKAFGISTLADLDQIKPFEQIADILLLDAKPPKDTDGSLPGGNGVPFDWHILQNYSFDKPVMLSGGLTSENVIDAVKVARPDMVDVSSGVEVERGVKSNAKIRDFIKAAKLLDH